MLSKEEIVNYLNNIIDKYYEKISEIGEDDYNEDLDDICCDINELIEEIEDEIENDDYYRGYNERDKLAKEICKKCKYRKQYRELESNNKKLIEKLEERRKQNNNRYGQAIDNDEFPEMYEYSGQVQEDDYILEILKVEKELEVKTYEEWAKELYENEGIEILDPDGFDRSNPNFMK